MKPLLNLFTAAVILYLSQVFALVPLQGEPIDPIPQKVALTSLEKKKAELGQKLFHDPILSKNNTISCATCHDLKRGGGDGLKFSKGIHQQLGDINTPTVFNSSYNIAQFWDGRAKTLEEQAEGPLLNKKEMGHSWPGIIAKLKKHKFYNERFTQLYKDGVQPKNITETLALFEKTLITPNSRFDRYLRGDSSALNQQEKAGYQLFKSYGCVACHQGVNMGGNMFQKFGIIGNYFQDRGHLSKADLGRYNVTGIESDKYKFKVPTLRNIALTAPYFHDGSAKTLEEAVEIMGKYQLGRKLSSKDIQLIVGFLKTLSGQYQGQNLSGH